MVLNEARGPDTLSQGDGSLDTSRRLGVWWEVWELGETVPGAVGARPRLPQMVKMAFS